MTNTERIVVIDDEKGMCDSLSALLRGDGFVVAAYQSAAAAAQHINSEKIDLVITDIKMPEMDGLEILRIVKQQDEGIPVIMMTGYGSLDTALDAISKGAYDYLLKPVDFGYLQVAVRRALEKRNADLERFKLLEELRKHNILLNRRVRELNALYEAGKSIGSSLNIAELLRQIVTLAATVTEAQTGSIMLLDESGEFLIIAAAIGLERNIVETTRLPIGESIAGHVAKTGEALRIENVEKDTRFRRINRERYGRAALLCSPLVIKNKVLGVINMANKSGDATFSEDDLRLLTTFASQAAVAVDDASEIEKSRRRLVEFEILQEIANELPTMESLSDFRQSLITKLKRVFPIDYAIWFHLDPSTLVLVPDGVHGNSNESQTESSKVDRASLDEAGLQLSPEEYQHLSLEDLRALSSFIGDKMSTVALLPTPGPAFMAIPIQKSGDLVYLFCMGATRESRYSPDDLRLARLVVSQSAILFEKEKSLLNASRLILMGNMISEISHDLRKPLTSFNLGLQVLKQRWPDLSQESEFVRSAEEEVHRMNELVRELVDFSSPNKYETTKFDLRDVVKRAAELMKPDMVKCDVSFDSEFAATSWELIANKNQILEVLLNLFINAIDAMPNGGRLKVSGLIERPSHKKEDYLALKVSDSGVGIRKEDLPRIFDRYYTTKETGTGLGLVVVERIISAHRGTLSVDSIEGSGTTFTVYFPLT